MSEVPPVSIDEAIELFLAITCPGGIPEGVDREVLVGMLRERIAADRPEWAAASAPPPAVAPPAPDVGYAQRKAEAIARAQGAEVPSDPTERYLEERRQEAHRNRALRHEEAEEEATRQRLIQRFMAEKRGANTGPEGALGLSPGPADVAEVLPPELDEETLQRALRIRKLLVERLERSRSIELDAPAVLSSGRPETNRPVIADEARELRAPALASWSEVTEVARDLSPDEQARIVRGFNESRRAGLKQREDLLAERRAKRADLLAERRPRREDLLAERRPRREDLLTERRPSRVGQVAEVELTERASASGLHIDEEPRTRIADGRQPRKLRVE
jgi:hypothetical protein